MGERRELQVMMKVLALLVCVAAVSVSEAADAQFYAPPPGSPQEVAAQNMYFERSSKIIVGLQQAYQWMNYGQIEAYKAYKSGLFRQVADMAHPMMLEEDDASLSGLQRSVNKEGKAVRVLPALPENKALAEYMKANEKKLEEQYSGQEEPLEMLSTMSKIAALKTMQLMQLMAPPQLAYFSVFKGFLNTVALSVLMQ